MNAQSMPLYTAEEQEIIRQYEARQLAAATAAQQTLELELRQAAGQAARWDNQEFVQKVASARKASGKWLFHMVTLAASFLLNCVLIQELTPDFAPYIARLAGVSGATSNFLATALMSTLVFCFLIMIKNASNITEEARQLRQGKHIAIAQPIRRTLAWKLGLKAFYLIVLAFGYHKLYGYIITGLEIETMKAETTRELAATTTLTLGAPGPDLGSIDTEIASSRAAVFLFFYSLEWLIHAAILFFGASPSFSPAFAFANKRQDLARHAEVAKRHARATARVGTINPPALRH